MNKREYKMPQIEVLILDTADILTISIRPVGTTGGQSGNAGGYWQNRVPQTTPQDTNPTNP